MGRSAIVLILQLLLILGPTTAAGQVLCSSSLGATIPFPNSFAKIETQVSHSLGFEVKIQSEHWDEFLDIRFVNPQGKRIGEIMLLYLERKKTLVIDYVGTKPYSGKGLATALLAAALIRYPETKAIKTLSMIADNESSVQHSIQKGSSVQDAIKASAAYKMRSKFGFTEILPESINADFGFTVVRP